MTCRWTAAMLMMVACCRGRNAPPRATPADAAPAEGAGDAAAPPDAAVDWRTGYDFDGDGRPDRITDAFTGGDRCCYRLTIHATASGAALAVPFDLDGGDPAGLVLGDGLQVVVGAGGRARLLLRIATYGGEREPFPEAWRRAWNLRRREAVVGVTDGALVIGPARWTCGDALAALTARRFEGWEGWPPGCGDTMLAFKLNPTVESATPAKLGTAGVDVSRRELRTSVVASHRGVAPVGAGRFVAYFDRSTVARVDVDGHLPISELVADLGPPPHRLPYRWSGTVEPRGLWLWPAQGIGAYVDHAGHTARRLVLFPATDRAGFEARVARPLDADGP